MRQVSRLPPAPAPANSRQPAPALDALPLEVRRALLAAIRRRKTILALPDGNDGSGVSLSELREYLDPQALALLDAAYGGTKG